MRYGKACLWIVVGLWVVLGGGCGKKAAEQMNVGWFKGPVYYNDYLGFTITLPADWSIQDPQMTQKMVQTGEQIIAGNDENLKAAFEASQARNFNLFTAFQHPLGSPVPYNPSLNVVAESVAHAPGIKTGADYLFHARRLLESGRMKFAFPREVYAETLAGAEFHVMTTEVSVPPAQAVKQEYLATVRKGHVLLLILSYSTDEERAALYDIVGTMTLTPQERP